ncbi:MAG: hypothetical protein K9I69_02670, partial [Ignavibacteriales bacterium]|nr:hypothetical protein [Ignavibacteriales bacterium]
IITLPKGAIKMILNTKSLSVIYYQRHKRQREVCRMIPFTGRVFITELTAERRIFLQVIL